jgi:hypothetical protein
VLVNRGPPFGMISLDHQSLIVVLTAGCDNCFIPEFHDGSANLSVPSQEVDKIESIIVN